MSSLGEVAASLPWPVFACDSDKRPVVRTGFKAATRDRTKILDQFNRPGAALIGVPTGAASGLVVIDVDVKNGQKGAAWLEENAAALPPTRTHKTRSGGLHLLFRKPAGVEIRNSASHLAPGVDVRGEGGYVVVPPSPDYQVADDTESAEMPRWLIKACLKEDVPPQPPPRPQEHHERYVQTAIDGEVLAVMRAAEGTRNDTLNKAAANLGTLVAAGQMARGTAEDELQHAGQMAGLSPREAAATIKSGLDFGMQHPREMPERRLNGQAHAPSQPPPPDGEDDYGSARPDEAARPQEGAPKDAADAFRPEPEPPPEPGQKTDASKRATEALKGFDLTEDGIALAFVNRHRDVLRFDHHVGAWYLWNDQAWRREETKLAFSWARDICRQLAKAENARSRVLARAATAAAVERFAQADRAFAVTSALWDADPRLLGTPGGTVDLRTGELRPAARTDYITKLTAVAPAESADCPLWLRFLNDATHGNSGFIRFLQQWSGYSLTGFIREHALLFVYGEGGNGKSTWINTIANVMNEYATVAAMDTFIASQGDRHPTDLAALRGARMVRASETEEGQAWSEVRIKALTGGDKIAARFMRQDFFEFTPQFKLTIIGNHMPELRNVDEAARRRFNVAPFTHKPPVIDKTLEDKLQAEWPAILRWMIDGCLDWQENSLMRPDVVTASTAEYFSEQDLMAQWLDECCERRDEDGIPAKDSFNSLLSSYRNFVKARGDEPGSSKGFGKAMRKRGFNPIKDELGIRGHGFQGIRVRRYFEPDD
jgi:P4 family phage/plasmid primase-like protien